MTEQPTREVATPTEKPAEQPTSAPDKSLNTTAEQSTPDPDHRVDITAEQSTPDPDHSVDITAEQTNEESQAQGISPPLNTSPVSHPERPPDNPPHPLRTYTRHRLYSLWTEMGNIYKTKHFFLSKVCLNSGVQTPNAP